MTTPAEEAALKAYPDGWAALNPGELARKRKDFIAGWNAASTWMPIDTAPKDNKRPLLLARFAEQGQLMEVDINGSWECESESWEMPEIYYFWGSTCGIEEPTHWMYQQELKG